MSTTQLIPGRELIADERQEHFEIHNYTIENDVKFNDSNQLTVAAVTLLLNTKDDDENFIRIYGNMPPKNWDQDIWIKMLKKPYKKRVKIAGSLCAAELDRLSYLDINKMIN